MRVLAGETTYDKTQRMFKLEQAFLADSRPENIKLAKELKKLYKNSVTTFMRDTAKMVKRLK